MLTILTICTGNAARSILAEAIFNRDGAGRVRAFSAGTLPRGTIPRTVTGLLGRRGLARDGIRSKNWAEFAAPGAPRLDVVLTLCHAAETEVSPPFPGQPVRAHWPIDDPLATPPDQTDLALQMVYNRLSARINLLLAARIETASRTDLAALMAL